MRDRSKTYLKVFSFLTIPVYLLIIAGYGWVGYATFTERPGLRGNFYMYYGLTRAQFYTYNFLLVFIALLIFSFTIKYLIENNVTHLIKLLWIFAYFIAIIIVCEMYLSSRFVGKG